MRRGIVLLIIIGLLIFLGYRVLSKPSRRPATSRRTTTDTVATRRRTGRRAGTLERKRTSREERRLERQKRKEEKKRLREERRRRRLEEKMRKRAMRQRKGKRVGYNLLQAIFYSESGSYVIIDGKTYKVGDEISGRRIVKIEKDKIIVEYHGTQKSVKVGESITPLSLTPTRRR
ncbi:MAG: hypothetical protein ABIK97_01795 [candidate division WOR-3 bacterium]